MASAWGRSFGAAWGNAWGQIAAPMPSNTPGGRTSKWRMPQQWNEWNAVPNRRARKHRQNDILFMGK